MRIFYIAVLLVLLVFGGIREAHAMRCGKVLIRQGDTIGKLIRHCGRPLYLYTDLFRERIILTYEINGRERDIVVINGRIRSGV